MDNSYQNQETDKYEQNIAIPAVQKPTTFANDTTTLRSKMPFARYFKGTNKKYALVYIFIPLLLFILLQNGPLVIIAWLISPLFLVSITYGLTLFLKKDRAGQNTSVDLSFSGQNHQKRSYRRAAIQLIIAVALFLIAIIFVLIVRQSAGYSGSEGEIVAIPFYLSGFVFILLSIGNFLATLIANSKK